MLEIPTDADFLVPDDKDDGLGIAGFPDGLIIASDLEMSVYTWRGAVDGTHSLAEADRILQGPREAYFRHHVAAFGELGGFAVATAGEDVRVYDEAATDPQLTIRVSELHGAPGVGDFSGDGTLDLAVKVGDCNDVYPTEYVHVYDGGQVGVIGENDSFSRLWSWLAGEDSSSFGCSGIMNAGDTDGDGSDDLVVGGMLFRGPLTGDRTDFDADATVSRGQVSPAGDIDGDGLDDIVVGDLAGAAITGANGSGELDADPLAIIDCTRDDGNAETDRSAVVADFNRDDVPDIAIPKLSEGIWIGHGPLVGTQDCYASGQRMVFEFPDHYPDEIELVATDLDGDGAPELVVNVRGAYPYFSAGLIVMSSAVLGLPE